MSGGGSGDRQSVWSLLDSMTPPRATREEQHGYDSDTSVMSMSESDASDDSSVMFCAPLEPDDTSEVELARSEVISLSDGSFAGVDERTEARPRGRLAGPWPFGVGGEVASEATGPPSQDPRPVERKVWVPSATKISLEVRWWGYRVYLPPSVLAVLDNHRIQASKRAALLTTALKWLLDHVPITAVPLQMRPALHLLRGLVPYLAYTGAFIAWSWSAVKMFDKGHGVVLTATWLLPLGLIPGAWEENMFAEADRPAADETDRPAAR
ncbi:hypothetical protein WOLCODRAFT_113031 [Wolfiporia cocos MD-104 SS10]|uniref:Uncharacterized protein n=1 Tax=Wolfiporia cocos (strain MD-104) TaxID=742152 RepID=A0A2H3IVL4_WOLCO|nr:hypothetical protein WOLCODRAFT_113031 [Wolfiporia cocos MD-104 SS10]